MDIAGSASRAKRVESHDIYARPRLASQIYLSLNVRLHTWWELRVHYELFTVHAFESLSGGKSDANASIAIDMWWSKWLSSSHACLHACKEENQAIMQGCPGVSHGPRQPYIDFGFRSSCDVRWFLAFVAVTCIHSSMFMQPTDRNMKKYRTTDTTGKHRSSL